MISFDKSNLSLCFLKQSLHLQLIPLNPNFEFIENRINDL